MRRKSKLESFILAGTLDEHQGTILMWKIVRDSKALRKVWAALKKREPDQEHILKTITEMKFANGVAKYKSTVTLSAYIENICDVTDFVYKICDLRDTAFDWNKACHKRQLERIWDLATNNLERKGGKFSSDWKHIGFGGEDPAKDLKDGGILALNQLRYICETRKKFVRRQHLSERGNSDGRYPWVYVGIVVTNVAVKFLKERILDIALLGLGETGMWRAFDEVYCNMFEAFHEEWVSSPVRSAADFDGTFQRCMAKQRLIYLQMVDQAVG
uniref:ELMO domain-containing protein n=1 Tax=Rhodosorus marinus TaxID=101924 RepID=A0A6T6KE09_9RHOD|mmetsp:Transcript_1261/g.1973  ORF Transcript_1261/g.1973 Transcript_1261/m.1973 type:complete len:272 (+) Transcript_1261:251-1066(+)